MDKLTPVSFRLTRPVLALLTLVLLSGCGSFFGSQNQRNAESGAVVRSASPPQWSAPLPHGGDLHDLRQWWARHGDPLLVELIEAAQQVSPSVAGARSRLTQARAALGISQSSGMPALSANASAQRGVNAQSPTVGTGLQASLDASWEIDLFGGTAASNEAASARVEGAQAQWHEARVSVAAEVASLYFGLRSCTQVLEKLQADSASRETSARLTELTAQAGFTAPATAALARSSAAEGRARARQQQSQCESLRQGLSALTALPAAQWSQRLASAPPIDTTRVMPVVASVPAQQLSQRPDLYAAERELAAASAEVGAAQAQRYPRLMLAGSVGNLNYRNAMGSTDLATWSIGPVAVSLPIFDGGRRAANAQAAQARYEEAAALYRSRVRQAVREVEDALQILASADARRADAVAASTGYAASFQATEARLRAGSASLSELEDIRRVTLGAQMALLQLDLERSNAWVSLYRALGGGWNPQANHP